MTMNAIYILTILAETIHLSQNAYAVEKSLPIYDNLNIKIKNGKINFFLNNIDNDAILQGEFGALLPEEVKSSNVSINDNHFYFGEDIKLDIEKNDKCYYFNWTTSKNMSLSDCFFYGADKWYGGPENYRQYWPFNNMTFSDFSYVTKSDQNQAIAEPYWVTSSGFYIYVNSTTPLFIDANNFYNNSLCLIARQADPYLPRGRTTLVYKVCAYKNVRIAHRRAVKADLGHPTGVPDSRMIQHPIWSTWVRYKLNINETAVRSFARQIIYNGFNNSQIEIDDNWESCYGSSTFNSSRFPNFPKLSYDLKSMGFRVTLWNHPFINNNCKLFNTLKDRGYLVKNQDGKYNTTWWDGPGGVIDFTNPAAVEWFLEDRRALLKSNSIDAIKMDAGESSWLPQIPQMNAPVEDQPDIYSGNYARAIAQLGDMVEVRVGHLTQQLPIFVRMIDKDTKWGFDNGLATLLTTMFQMNLNGYPFVLPDMVGGNAYNGDRLTKELLIRWLQANTFMPTIQFSIAPFDFDNETLEICKKFTAMHYDYSSTIISKMEDCVQSGMPVNPPIWWVDPEDTTAQDIWSEYMLGEDILVAPVLEEGATSRDIYLPRGYWRAEADVNRTVYQGRTWLRNYPAPLTTLPYFTRCHQSISTTKQ